MARGGDKHRRKQRQKKWTEQQVANYQEGAERDEPSGGQFFVLHMETDEKHPGLNLKQTKELWRSLPNAIYLEMDSYTPGRAPLRARFDAGNLP